MTSDLGLLAPGSEIVREHGGMWVAVKNRAVVAHGHTTKEVWQTLLTERIKGAVARRVPDVKADKPTTAA